MSPEGNSSVHSGFPSPAQDYMNDFISLDKELVRHPAATFFARMSGDAMADAGVGKGDVLVIDKAIEPQEGDLAVCFIDGEFALKKVSFKEPSAPAGATSSRKASKPGVSYNILEHKKMWLLSADGSIPPVEVSESNDFTVWGVVTYVIKEVCTRW